MTKETVHVMQNRIRIIYIIGKFNNIVPWIVIMLIMIFGLGFIMFLSGHWYFSLCIGI